MQIKVYGRTSGLLKWAVDLLQCGRLSADDSLRALDELQVMCPCAAGGPGRRRRAGRVGSGSPRSAAAHPGHRQPRSWQLPLQDNFCDCGLFLLTYAEFFTHSLPDHIRTKSRQRLDPAELAGAWTATSTDGTQLSLMLYCRLSPIHRAVSALREV